MPPISPELRDKAVRHARTFTAKVIAWVAVPILWLAVYINGVKVNEEFTIASAMLDNLYAYSLVCDQNGTIVYANKRAEELTGYTLAELKAGGALLLIPPELERLHTISMAKAFSEKVARTVTFRSEYCTKNHGERIPATFRTSVYEVNGKWYSQTLVLPDFVLEEIENTPEYVTE